MTPHIMLYFRWDCEWDKLRESDPEIVVFLEKYLSMKTKNTSTMTEKSLLKKIKTEGLYGCGRADLKVPKHLRDNQFSEFGAFIVKRKLTNESSGDHMQEFIENSGRKVADQV